MSWFGGGLSNLQGKITSFTAQVLNEVAESVQGDDEQEISEQVESDSASEEILKFRKQNEDLLNQNRELESQLSTLSRQYRNLLSSSKSNHETANGASNEDQVDPQPQVVESESSWQKDVQHWLKSQGLELPPNLRDRVVQLNGAESNDDSAHLTCQILEKKVAALEEQLVDLDQQHQTALEVAVSSRDQLKEHNRQLQLQLLQLVNDRNPDQQKKSGTLFPIHEESEDAELDHEADGSDEKSQMIKIAEEELERLEGDQQFFRQQIDQFQKHFQILGDKLTGFETIQSQNDQLKQEVISLQESASQLESDRQTAESRLSQENADLKLKLEALENQNQILTSMTSVLDRVTNENRLLESNLESANQTLQFKLDLIDQLKTELLCWQNKPQTVSDFVEIVKIEAGTEPQCDWPNTQELVDQNRLLQTQLEDLKKACQLLQSSSENNEIVQIETGTEPQSDWPNIQEVVDENRLLQSQLEDLKASQLLQSSSEVERVEELMKDNEILKEQITEAKETLEDCRTKMEETEAYRLKLEADLTRIQNELMLSKLELERTQDEKHLLESNIDSLNQVILSHNEQVDLLKNERLSLLNELEEFRTVSTTKKVEASTETQFDDQETQRLIDENLSLQFKLEELQNEHESKIQLLQDEITEFRRRLSENEDALERHQNQSEETQVHRRTLETELGQLQEELETARKRCDELSDSNTRQDEVMSRLQSELEESRLSLSETSDLCQKERIRNEEIGQICDLKTKQVHDLLQEIEVLRTRHLTLEGEKNSNSELQEQILSLTKETTSNREEISQLVEQLETIRREHDKLNSQVVATDAEKELLRETLQAFQQQREQLVQTVQQKHQEAVSYHAETLRLAKICEELQIRLNEQNELEQEAVRLRSEIETYKSAHVQKQAEIERLRSHLLNVEETYTQELLKSQTKERTLKESLQAAEERASEQWRMGDQLNVWQDKYRQCLADKERLEKEKDSQEKSLDRLQHALQQLTRERERDIVLAQKELAQKLAQAESLQNEKDSEMGMLGRKLAEAQLGLEAAGRLTQQLDKTTAALTAAKEEVRTKETELANIRRQMEDLRSGTDSKVDRSLVKNLLIGYFSAPSAKNRLEILRIIATVMDFSSDERRKSGIEETSSGLSGWATGLLKMNARSRTSSGNSSTGEAEKSLSEAFINFLESESVRPSPPKLPAQKVDGSPSSTNSSMTEFQPGRNEPTILRDVLRDTET